MSAPDRLTPIVESVAEAMWDRKNAPRTWAEDATFDEAIPALAQVRAFVSRAAPLIAEQIAAAIEADRDRRTPDGAGAVHDTYDRGILYGLSVANRIAREWSPR